MKKLIIKLLGKVRNLPFVGTITRAGGKGIANLTRFAKNHKEGILVGLTSSVGASFITSAFTSWFSHHEELQMTSAGTVKFEDAVSPGAIARQFNEKKSDMLEALAGLNSHKPQITALSNFVFSVSEMIKLLPNEEFASNTLVALKHAINMTMLGELPQEEYDSPALARVLLNVVEDDVDLDEINNQLNSVIAFGGRNTPLT